MVSAIAAFVGVACTGVAFLLLRLIDLFTNLFFFGQLSLAERPPAENALGWWVVLIPALGGLIVGLMARFGSERIRGHGIPEAMEAILIGQSRMQPRVALLKPLSSAIAIGSGGPFGAEGPIVMTGGALGSIIAQAFRLSSAERKTLLVAGAAGGMTAIFNTPVAGVLLAVELLLFEWKPRSLIPVALASCVAAVLRPLVFGAGPFFPVPPHAAAPGAIGLGSAAVLGVLAGLLSLVATLSIYAVEDGFHRLPIHWMWWPALGGLVVGLGGVFQPRALGVGYPIIGELLAGHYVAAGLVGLFVVKGLIWAVALGSGTSGGVLAPLLILGGTLGALATRALPGGDAALWPLVGMAGVLAGTMRMPLAAAVFALELTGDFHALLPLLVGSMTSFAVASTTLRHSILTEKVARRGYHISHEYAVDPLERLTVGGVMTREPVTVPAALPVGELIREYFWGVGPHKHPSYPIVGRDGRLLGLVTRSGLLEHWMTALLRGGAPGGEPAAGPIIAYDLAELAPIVAHPEETCRAAAERMAAAGVKRLLVVGPEDPARLLGIVTLGDLLKARQQLLEEEARRERFLLGTPRASAG
jgi:H+/Cl- antiporter ClcA/CBS domain-containing protein